MAVHEVTQRVDRLGLPVDDAALLVDRRPVVVVLHIQRLKVVHGPGHQVAYTHTHKHTQHRRIVSCEKRNSCAGTRVKRQEYFEHMAFNKTPGNHPHSFQLPRSSLCQGESRVSTTRHSLERDRVHPSPFSQRESWRCSGLHRVKNEYLWINIRYSELFPLHNLSVL